MWIAVSEHGVMWIRQKKALVFLNTKAFVI